MFIFLDTLEFSPKLPADGESEIRGYKSRGIGGADLGLDPPGTSLFQLWHMNCTSYWDKNPHSALMADFGHL